MRARRGAGIAPGRTIGTHPLTIVARSAKSGGCQPAVSREPHWQENATLAGGRTTSGAAGVSPPCDREPRLQRHFRNYSRDCLLCTDERRCNHGSETTGDLRPPLLFAHVRPPTELRLLRSTNADVPGAAGVSPPWFGEPRMQGKSQIASHRGFVQPQEQRASARRESGTAHARTIPRGFAHRRRAKRQERRVSARRVIGNRDCNGTSTITRETAYCVLTNAGAITAAKPRGAYVPRSCSRTFARRRNYDFCDPQTQTYQERRASARRGSGNALATALPQLLASLPTVY